MRAGADFQSQEKKARKLPKNSAFQAQNQKSNFMLHFTLNSATMEYFLPRIRRRSSHKCLCDVELLKWLFLAKL